MDRTHLRDVSFSSYLSMVGENFSIDVPPPNPCLVPARGPRRAKTSAGDELGVFSAERYYNMGVLGYQEEVDINNNESARKVEVTRTPNRRRDMTNNFRTPSVISSEGSSQSALMLAYAKRNKATSTSSNSFFSGIGCYGRSCSDKDSVIVRKPLRKSEVCQIVFDGTKQSLPRFKDEPVALRSPVSIASSSESHRIEEARVSLEVFGSSNLERKLSMLTWDAVPKSQSMIKDEIESDASSDLFEIENISSQNGYEPSEASIEWSVVTASAADFSSGNNMEYDEKKQTPRKGVGILGCKSYKAVRVVEPLPAPKSSYRATLPLGLTSHLRHNQSQAQ